MEARERILYAKSENYFCTKVNRWPFWAEWAETTHLIYQYLISVNKPKWLISSVILRRDPTSSYKKKVIEYLKKLGLPTHSGNMRPGIVLHRADKHRQSLWGFHPGTRRTAVRVPLAMTWRSMRPSSDMPPQTITDPQQILSYWITGNITFTTVSPDYGSVQVFLCNGWFPPCTSDCAGRHSTPFAAAAMDVQSWKTWTTCAAWLGCRYLLMLLVVTRILAEHKTREESARKDQERAVDCGHHMQIQGDLRVSDGFSGQTWNHLNTCLLTRSAGTPWLDGHSRWRSREVLLWLAVGYWCCI